MTNLVCGDPIKKFGKQMCFLNLIIGTTAQWGYRASIHIFSLFCLFVSPQGLLGLFLQVPDHPEHDPYHFHHPQSPYSCLRRRRSVSAWFHKPILLKPYPIQIVPSSNCTLLKLYPPPFALRFVSSTEYPSDMPLSWYSKVVFDLVSLFGGAVLINNKMRNITK